MKKADYTKISLAFDKGRSLSEDNLQLWINRVAKYGNIDTETTLLDLGCGTGRFAIPIAQSLRIKVTGADLSIEMLKKAREKKGAGQVTWDCQNAEMLPYLDSSFDIIFMSQLLHNVDKPLKVISESKRVLRSPGVILIRYGSFEQIRDDIEHRFFPETLAIDQARWPTISMVEDWLSDASFNNIISEEIIQKTYKTGIAHLNAISTKTMSSLTLISQEAFEVGFRNLEKYIQHNPQDPSLLYTRLTFTVGYKN